MITIIYTVCVLNRKLTEFLKRVASSYFLLATNSMLYMIVETFKNEAEMYRRFREKGRMMPTGLNYISSWVQTDFKKCYQLMETENVKLLDEWIANWSDIVDFEVFPVMTSSEATEKRTE